MDYNIIYFPYPPRWLFAFPKMVLFNIAYFQHKQKKSSLSDISRQWKCDLTFAKFYSFPYSLAVWPHTLFAALAIHIAVN